ncbi:hypothetical protein HPB48_021866 [Haemaphysalis longicornis]|uniref:Uncharacterized protein n=1 Tax=Haemaphysalis longicornis TaxID=44386 RepID=A0A9J6FQ40_HAELO|nr:hypothetical protein HPB48_021866 [Haemaphysalis longicornis]
MHDILEGGVAVVLRRFLCILTENRVLTKVDLEKLTSFRYGHYDKKATPVTVKDIFVAGKGCPRGTASQKCCLFRLLPQIFGAVVPEGNRLREVYLAYHYAVDIILAVKIPKGCVLYLQVKVEEFLKLHTTQIPMQP